MLTVAQEQKISLLSDSALYTEAVEFMRHLLHDLRSSPIPTSQIMGLLNVSRIGNFGQIYNFVVHQRDRDWPGSKKAIKIFYTELEKVLAEKRRSIARSDLLTTGLDARKANQEKDELLAALAREYIQHLVAENIYQEALRQG